MSGWTNDQYDHVLQGLHQRGLGDGTWGEMRTESGHFLTVSPPSDEDGHYFGVGSQWKMHVKHPGDPFGSWIVSGLGHDHTQVPDRMMHELRQRDVMNHMRDQMSRAELNGDAHGYRDNPGGPGRWADEPSAVFSRWE